MEFLLVHYDRRRNVYVNGTKAGYTNRALRINRGRHRIDLGDDANYSPASRRIDIAGTTPQTPLEIDFVRAS